MRTSSALLLLISCAACSSQRPAPTPAASLLPALPASVPAPVASAPAPIADAGASELCEGVKHATDGPARGFADDRAFTVSVATIRSQSGGEFAKMDLELGSLPDRFGARGMADYRGVEVNVFADRNSLSVTSGTYAIPRWEKGGPIWGAMINVRGNVGTSVNPRGEVVIDEIVVRAGKKPARARGHLWVCFDSLAEFPGPLWIGGTFDAEISLIDSLHKDRAAIAVKTGEIVLTRPKQK